MTLAIHEFTTRGHELLVQSQLSPAAIAAKIGVAPQRVSQWRAGRGRPTSKAREALSRARIVPAAAWDAPPTTSAKPTARKTATDRRGEASPKRAGAPPAVHVDVAGLASASADELEAFGLEGLEGVVGRLRKLAPELPPRERVQAVACEGRLHATIANLRAREADARRGYLTGPEFTEDMKILATVVPGSAAEFRSRLVRLGVELPTAPPTRTETTRPPPRSKADVEGLFRELEVAEAWRAKGEPLLAAAHVLTLCLDVHADAIAVVLAGASELAGRFLGLLEPADERVIAAALERRVALADLLRLPAAARRSVAALLEAHGLDDLAVELGGAS